MLNILFNPLSSLHTYNFFLNKGIPNVLKQKKIIVSLNYVYFLFSIFRLGRLMHFVTHGYDDEDDEIRVVIANICILYILRDIHL